MSVLTDHEKVIKMLTEQPERSGLLINRVLVMAKIKELQKELHGINKKLKEMGV